jgi:predicted secreted hydrolase
LITVDGELLTLGRRDLTLTPQEDAWISPNGVRYPSHWRLLMPSRELELEIRPLLSPRVLREGVERGSEATDAAVRSGMFSGGGWQTAVQVSGWRAADAISGQGQMDLNGYASSDVAWR